MSVEEIRKRRKISFKCIRWLNSNGSVQCTIRTTINPLLFYHHHANSFVKHFHVMSALRSLSFVSIQQIIAENDFKLLYFSSLITIHCVNLSMCINRKRVVQWRNPPHICTYNTNNNNRDALNVWMLSTLKCIWVFRWRTEVNFFLMATKRKWHKRKLREFQRAKSEKDFFFLLRIAI